MKWKCSVRLIILWLIMMNLNACIYEDIELKQYLGELIFNDASLSRDGTQSCASCHEADRAFFDPRVNATSLDASTPGAVSLGQDDIALGDINSPSIAYVAMTPEFHFDEDAGVFRGGILLNGRTPNVLVQARLPFLSALEMQTTEAEVVAKVEDSYGQLMEYLYGDDVFDSVATAFDAVADSLAEFEKSDQMATFDSKFDKALVGDELLSDTEQRGLALFMDEEKGNCAACHPVPTADSLDVDSLFTDFGYTNLGVPKNNLVRSLNGRGLGFVDEGLFDNNEVTDVDLKGAFRIVSLRNVAVTPPYMHNGVFADLETVVHFINSRDVPGALNPETGLPWQAAEVDATKNTNEIGDLGLDAEEVSAIVAFLKTLTDERYESFIEE
ncbi:MAG: methylamine utilization protein MauG [Moraxellaceae bacterium]|nr:MAG: methylamine utilization protein MauG [Moraxellaceae bacterium]